jgi:ssDNA-binding Zn-finger/Zn-ribbon topoisomerase 1
MTSKLELELSKRVGQKSAIPCPGCGAVMRYRRNRENGSYFLGCGDYPNCTCTMEIPETLKMDLLGQKRMFME